MSEQELEEYVAAVEKMAKRTPYLPAWWVLRQFAKQHDTIARYVGAALGDFATASVWREASRALLDRALVLEEFATLSPAGPGRKGETV